MRKTLTTSVLAAGMALALALAGLAQARIILNRGVEPARIGMTPAQVRGKLGRPDVVETSGSTMSLVYRSRELVVTVLRGRVQIVSTRSRHERTVKGVGPGSTLRAVRERVRGARCGAKAGVYVCKIGSSRKRRRSTVFLFDHGVVATVSVALAP